MRRADGMSGPGVWGRLAGDPGNVSGPCDPGASLKPACCVLRGSHLVGGLSRAPVGGESLA